MNRSILLKECTLIDGVSEQPFLRRDILISDGVIKAIGTNISPDDLASTTVIPLQGCSVAPGLIDAHVHLAFDASLDPINHLTNESRYWTLLRMVQNARLNLSKGVTTIRDLGGPGELLATLRQAIMQGVIAGPRLLIAGEVITTTGGHCHFIGHEVDDPWAIRRAARLEIKRGVDAIKIMAGGGASTPGSSVFFTQFTAEEIESAVTEAHARGLRVAAHANSLESIRNAVTASVDSIEHGSYADDAILEQMAVKGTWLVPTMAPARIILESEQVSDTRKEKVKRNWDARQQAVVKSIALGIRLACGTDAGVTLTEHGGAAREIEIFHQLGLPPMQSIWTATRWAAELLGIENQVGSLAKGRTADLLVVKGNPLEDLTLLQAPLMVMRAGQIVMSNGIPSH